MITPEEISRFQEHGYVVYRAAFSAAEVKGLRDEFMRLRENGRRYEHDDHIVDPEANDPLLRYPRLMNIHHWHAKTRGWLVDPRVIRSAAALADGEALAMQSMVYFKPPGARGQALHQDKFFLRVRPGTTTAAWMALDDTDEANGCMVVVKGSQDWPVLCAAPADTTESFTGVTIDLPPGAERVPVPMRAGDILFFNGTLVHGSHRNTTADRWRRSLIGHYVGGRVEVVPGRFQPLLTAVGGEVRRHAEERGGPCGVWVPAGNGTAVLEHEAGELPEKPSARFH
jgi:phytanoyl-CoA hydroxylase